MSGKFDASWAIAQLIHILTVAGKAVPEHQVMEWLADFGPRFPREAARRLELFAEGCDWDFHMSLWKCGRLTPSSAPLSPIRSRKSAMRQRELINRLGSRGHRQFRNMVQNGGN